ncbi:MAG: hypothetical protein EOM76_08835 [Sphingobacteriia bacterium]|nr:hypothetical protein [Sphingobacteriia bacterium]
MSMGDFGNFGSWSPKDQALNKMVYDEAHKKGAGFGGGGDNGKNGCSIIFIILMIIAAVLFLSR